ncbi:hypothetical protein LV75_000461 [Actinokineospora diospyrosa]|uniref:Uncharacterized protein n=2 Tax=Actinokineospora diospyrosa TaxID=103728 RepID=A0ABT1I5X8_9PSEU|nr:hypothetical protein [Actinokineospora diospyrosa]
MSHGWFHAFPRAQAAAARPLTERRDLPGTTEAMDQLLARQLAAGAYLLTDTSCPAEIMLGLHNSGPVDVAVRDIQVVDRQRGPIIDGVAFWLEAGAMNPNPITFHLDTAIPVARLVADNGNDPEPYFGRHTLAVLPGGYLAVPLRFDAATTSHTFNLSVKYRVDGQVHTCTVDNHGTPFRVSPTAGHYCADKRCEFSLSSRLDQRHDYYTEVYSLVFDDGLAALAECTSLRLVT